MDKTEFEHQFGKEQQCRDYIYHLRWPNGYRCPKCGNDKMWMTSDGKYKCTNCAHMPAITTGTIFYKNKQPLTKWFHMMWLLSSDSNLSKVTIAQLQEILQIKNNKTVISMRNRIKPALVPAVKYQLDKLSGYIEVIVSEVVVGGKEIYLAAAAEKIDRRTTGRIRGTILTAKSGDHINAFLDSCVENDAVIVTKLNDYGIQSEIKRHGYNVQSRDYYFDYNLPHAGLAELKLRLCLHESLNIEEICRLIDNRCAEINSRFLPISFEEVLKNAVSLKPDEVEEKITL